MKTVSILLTVLPGAALAHGGHMDIAEPLHMLSHWGHVVGAVVIVGALFAFYRERDRS